VPKFLTFLPFQIFGVQVPKNFFYMSDNAHLMAHHAAKFSALTPSTPKVTGVDKSIFKPILDPSLKKCKRDLHPRWGCASKTWSFSSTCKNLGVQHPKRLKYCLLKKSIWVGMIQPLGLCIHRTKVHQIFLPNARGIAVNQVLAWFWISSSVLNIFAAKFEVVQNMAKFCMFLAPEIFLQRAP